MRYSGDLTKAIAAGASTVMLGSLLAGIDESPGNPFIKNGKKFKVVRGMAFFGANLGCKERAKGKQNVLVLYLKALEALKQYKGAVADTIYQLLGGLYSAMSYWGVTSIKRAVRQWGICTDNGSRCG